MDNQSPIERQRGEEAASAPPDLSGQTLGDFLLLRRLGQGGMGQVYLAEQISLKRKVAVKTLRPDLAADEVSLRRFKAEAENVARATHANIVQVYAIGDDKGLHFMALEYVEGRNLREYLEKKGPPETLIALGILRQVAAALQRACELGIIHRDIKPENILLTRKGEVKVADFGLSRCFAGDAQPLNLTRSGISMGTPLYMSPEQVQGKPVDHRADIYSFGATAYHLFAGHPPYRGASPFDVAVQHVQNEPTPLGEIRPDLPPELCAMVHKMMAKKPEDRYQTGREIVKEISRLRDALAGVGSTLPSPAITMGPSAPLASDVASTQKLSPYRRRRFAWAVVGTMAVALAVGLWLGAARRKTSPPSSDDPVRQKILADNKQKEQELIKLVHGYSKSKNPLDMMEGLNRSIKLGVAYLKERRLEEADEFFKGLDVQDMNFQYRTLGKLGQAMVLAYRDRPEESNQAFQAVLSRAGKQDKVGRLWLHTNPAVREMIADALEFNYRNAPATFPAALQPWRQLPVAETKRKID
jgi:serine/threonine-protein kinase